MKHKAATARSRLDELSLDTFNVRPATVSGVNGIGHIDWVGLQRVVTLLDCRRPKGAELPKSSHLDPASISAVIAAGSKAGRKSQHGVGLAIKGEIVKKVDKDGIAFKCISARLLKDDISIKSNFVTFVVAYVPPEETLEWQKVKYTAALNSTVASVPTREYVFVLTGANASTGRGDEGGGEANSKVLCAYGRDVLKENGKKLLGFLEDNKLTLLDTFSSTPRSGVSYTFPGANRSKGQARLD